MTHTAHPRILHVANGTSTTRLIAAAGLPGNASIWADPLHEGPVPGGLTDAELVQVRHRFLSDSGDPATAAADEDPSRDRVNDLRQWRAVLEDRDAYDELVLWFEHDLFDQLNLVQLLAWIADHLRPAPPVWLICIESFPGRPAFKGLGELTPSELAPLLGTRRPVSDPEYQLARRVWQAFRDSTPQGLDRIRHGDTLPLPFISPALSRFLEEYPWTTDGLSRTERRLLELADRGPISVSQLFPRMHEGERCYYVTDRSLAGLAEMLSRTSPPLLHLEPGSGLGSALQGTVALTEAGRSVLARRLDRIAACGIDRWFGGVHLHAHAPIWRWDPDGQRIAG